MKKKNDTHKIWKVFCHCFKLPVVGTLTTDLILNDWSQWHQEQIMLLHSVFSLSRKRTHFYNKFTTALCCCTKRLFISQTTCSLPSHTHTHTHTNIAKAFKSVGTETPCWNPHVSGGHISCHVGWPPRTGYTVRSSRGTTKWCVFSHYSLLEIEGFAPGSWNTSLDCAEFTRKGYPKRSSIMNPTSANEILKMHKLQFFGRFMV